MTGKKKFVAVDRRKTWGEAWGKKAGLESGRGRSQRLRGERMMRLRAQMAGVKRSWTPLHMPREGGGTIVGGDLTGTPARTSKCERATRLLSKITLLRKKGGEMGLKFF